MRVPPIMWWPGQIKPGVVMEPGSTLDLLPTFCALAGIELSGDQQWIAATGKIVTQDGPVIIRIGLYLCEGFP